MTRALVVVNGDDTHHDLITASLVFQQLGAEAGLATRRAAGTGRFIDPRPETAGADVYLLYLSGGEFGTGQQEALAGLVADGKGLVGVHCTSVLRQSGNRLDPADRPMFELLGCRYLSHGPGHHEGRHTVQVTPGHPATEGVTDFEVFDEYYECELADRKITVLATRRRDDGQVIPVMYARQHGAGRVVYLALGHDLRAWGEPAFRSLVRQSLAWAAR